MGLRFVHGLFSLCGTNMRTVAYSQYFSFSLRPLWARCRVTFWASRAPGSLSQGATWWGNAALLGTTNVQGRKRETCCSFISALCKPALMRSSAERLFELLLNEHGHIFPLSVPCTPGCTVDKAAVFWQLGGDALSVCTCRTLMETCHPSPSLGSGCLCSSYWGHWLVVLVAMQKAVMLGTDHRAGRHLLSILKKLLYQSCSLLCCSVPNLFLPMLF